MGSARPTGGIGDWPCACVYVCVCGKWECGVRGQTDSLNPLNGLGGKLIPEPAGTLESGKVGWSPAPLGAEAQHTAWLVPFSLGH